MIIPHGFHDVHGIGKWLGSQPTLIPWIPYGIPGGVHGFQVDSIWIIPGKVKTSLLPNLELYLILALRVGQILTEYQGSPTH